MNSHTASDVGGSSSPFLRNAWYVAGWSSELAQSDMLARTILGMPVLMFRDEANLASAIGDRCPHRMAPLHLGNLENGQVTCGYHGLAFGKDGKCVRNPHGAIGSLAVPSYPIVERDGILWIWRGIIGREDPDEIPSFASLDITWSSVCLLTVNDPYNDNGRFYHLNKDPPLAC